MRKFIGSREAILRLAERHGLRPFTETGGEVPIDVRKGRTTSAARATFLEPDGVGLPAEASRPLFDFGQERLETLTPRVFIFGQPGLEQTQETKSVVHAHRRVTPRALVQLRRHRWEQISAAIEYHWKGKSQERG